MGTTRVERWWLGRLALALARNPAVPDDFAFTAADGGSYRLQTGLACEWVVESEWDPGHNVWYQGRALTRNGLALVTPLYAIDQKTVVAARAGDADLKAFAADRFALVEAVRDSLHPTGGCREDVRRQLDRPRLRVSRQLQRCLG